ncbi:ATP12 family protein [Parasphingorhabdus sp.]|uniref:ATP12 family chaperone protein n=1 Tax=Parasphingorhabdus sp. TaxID=2709688 RepID=UPI0032651B42
MKRFYKDVSVSPDGDAFAILLDGRPMKTPQRHPLAVPNVNLADAIATEWAAQGEDILPGTMPLTGLAQGALDQVEHERDRIVSRIAAFADSDMLYYRADPNQQALIDYQADHWDPLLDWAKQRYDVSFNLICGIRYEAQPVETIARLTSVVAAQDDYSIAAMLSLVGLSGSLIATLALVEQVHDVEALWPQVNLEELWQEQQWGRDDQATAARDIKKAEFAAAAHFLDLSRS